MNIDIIGRLIIVTFQTNNKHTYTQNIIVFNNREVKTAKTTSRVNEGEQDLKKWGNELYKLGKQVDK